MKAQPKVDLDATGLRLQRVGLKHAAEVLGERLADAVKSEASAHAFLDRLLDDELAFREERRIRTSLQLSGLPTGQTLASSDFAFQPNVAGNRIETLATCAWLRAKETLLIQGPPGVWKIHVAIVLGVKEVENGFSVMLTRLEELLANMRRDADLPPAELRQRKYLNAPPLIIDEVGFELMTRHESSLFFRLVSSRYGRGSILITTNRHPRLARPPRRRRSHGHRHPRPPAAPQPRFENERPQLSADSQRNAQRHLDSRSRMRRSVRMA